MTAERPAGSGFSLPSIDERERVLLAPYAMHSADSAGREHPELAHPYRGPFQRDRDRIVHSAAYRRLSSKTQVFTGELGDYHRTRLTHTLEVASVARTIGRALALNEDLIEALALVHDLGHPPFGHAGEDLLDECLRAEGGFSHNAQALRIVASWRPATTEFPGLNLSREVLEGAGAADRPRSPGAAAPCWKCKWSRRPTASPTTRTTPTTRWSWGCSRWTSYWKPNCGPPRRKRVSARAAGIEGHALRRAILHELIDWQVGDLLERAAARLSVGDVDSPQAARALPPVIVAGGELAEQKRASEAFLRERVYRHPDVLSHRIVAQRQLQTMFDGYVANAELLPPNFQRRAGTAGLKRTVGDYLAGMTDRFAHREYLRLFHSDLPPLASRGGPS